MTVTTAGAPRDEGRPADLSSASRTLVFWVMLALIVVGAALLVTQDLPRVRGQSAAAVVALLAWVIYGAVIIAILVRLQRYGRRPGWAVVAALAWGGLAAAAYSVPGGVAMHELVEKIGGAEFAQAYAASISAPIVEESLKAIGIVGLALIPAARLRSPLAGLFYGVLIGVGFQVVEDFSYTMAAAPGRDPFALVAGMVFLRGFLTAFFGHAVYSGIVGAGIGYFVSRRRGSMWRRLGVAVGAFVAAMVMHAVFDLQGTLSVTTFIVGAVPLAILLGLLWWARRDEARRLASIASVAVERGLMTAEEADALRHDESPPGGRTGKRLRRAQLRYLEAVDESGADAAGTEELAAEVRRLRAAG